MNGQQSKVCSSRCISWTAIFAGAFVGIGLCFLLNLFNVAIGLTVLTTNSATSALTYAVGGFLGMAIGVFVSTFLGGMTAGALGHPSPKHHHLGILYGFVTWTVGVLLFAMMAGAVGRYVQAYGNFISRPAIIGMARNKMPEMRLVNMGNKSNASMSMNAKANDDNSMSMMANQPKVMEAASTGAFVIFLLFFLGAFSSCLGGYVGMVCCHKDEE